MFLYGIVSPLFSWVYWIVLSVCRAEQYPVLKLLGIQMLKNERNYRY